MKKILLIIIISSLYPQFVNSIELKKYYQFPDNYFQGKFIESTKNFFFSWY